MKNKKEVNKGKEKCKIFISKKIFLCEENYIK